MKKSDAVQAIRQHVVDGVPLSDKHKEIYERLTAAFTLLCQYRRKSIAVQQLVKQFDISQSQAYKAVSNAEVIFGNVRKYHKESLRYMVIEALFEDIEEFDKRAKTVLPLDTSNPGVMELRHWEIAKTLKQKALATIGKVGGLDRDDIEIPDFSQLQTPDIQINLHVDTLNLLDKLPDGGLVDLGKLRELASGGNNALFNDTVEEKVEITIVDDEKETG